MKKTTFSNVVVTMAVVLTGASVQASIVNPGFESSPDFTGWSVSHPSLSSVVTSHTSVTTGAIVYGPKEGSKFAKLTTGGGAGVYTTLSQSIFLSAGDVISGWAAFDAGDYLPFNDNALATVTLSSATTLFASNVSAVGNYGETPWTFWTFTAGSTATYLLEYKVANQGDNGVDSYALFDAAAVVPEPSTYLAGALLALPFGLQGARWLRTRKQVS